MVKRCGSIENVVKLPMMQSLTINDNFFTILFTKI